MISEIRAEDRTRRTIESLIAGMQNGVRGWYSAMRLKGIFPYLYSGFRSLEEQQTLYDRYKKGEGGLAAPPGKSYHNYGCAFDWAPLKPVNGYPNQYEPDWDDEQAYKEGERIAPVYGLTAIPQETGHLQDARCKSWEDAKRLYDQSLWPMT